MQYVDQGPSASTHPLEHAGSRRAQFLEQGTSAHVSSCTSGRGESVVVLEYASLSRRRLHLSSGSPHLGYPAFGRQGTLASAPASECTHSSARALCDHATRGSPLLGYRLSTRCPHGHSQRHTLIRASRGPRGTSSHLAAFSPHFTLDLRRASHVRFHEARLDSPPASSRDAAVRADP